LCVNCAGIAPAKRTLDREGEAMPLANFKSVIDINLIGTFNVARVAASAMAKNEPLGEAGERGLIVNTASVAGYEGQIGQAAYAASKGGIIALCLPMARDLAPLGIRVNTIAPGVMGTPMLLAMPEKVQEALVHNVQFPKRLGLPNEFGKLVLHMANNPYLNGETVRLDGALRMPPK
jgi:NAD(P)-dependent dehydrogenase (short-subunit alcohol dehydrogenase family)